MKQIHVQIHRDGTKTVETTGFSDHSCTRVVAAMTQGDTVLNEQPKDSYYVSETSAQTLADADVPC